MLNEKDSEIEALAAIGPVGTPSPSKYDRLIAKAKEVPAATTIVVYPCDETSLRGPIEAAEAGIIVPILVGPAAKIAAVARGLGLNIDRFEIVDVPDSEAAAAKAVELIHQSKGELLMKGSLHTDELMREVTAARPACAQRGGSATSSSWMCQPTPRPSFITDAAINIFPDLDAKRDIVQNAIDLFTQVGLGTPRVAILSAVETVTSKIPSTIEAAALCKMAERGQITGGILDGPLAFDNAIDLEAARIKGIKSEVAGRAQILIVPDLEAGNMLAKNLAFMAKADFSRHRSWRPRADHPDLPRRFRCVRAWHPAPSPYFTRTRGAGRPNCLRRDHRWTAFSSSMPAPRVSSSRCSPLDGKTGPRRPNQGTNGWASELGRDCAPKQPRKHRCIFCSTVTSDRPLRWGAFGDRYDLEADLRQTGNVEFACGHLRHIYYSSAHKRAAIGDPRHR